VFATARLNRPEFRAASFLVRKDANMPKHYDAEVKFRPRPLHQVIFEQAFNIWFKVDRLPTFRRATVHGQHLPDQDNTSGRGRSSFTSAQWSAEIERRL
jgi:hypothetical protein